MRSSNRYLCTATVLVLAGASPLFAQDSLQKIKDLYASAAYEDTLSAVTSLGVAEPKPEIEQYRIFSLVALGRVPEAEQAVEAVLTAHPRYRPDAAEASPRIQDLFAKVRKQIAPDAVKAMYRDGRAALDKKDRDAAIALFDEMVRTADDPDLQDLASVAELRLLGSGFLDLSRALPARAGSAEQASPAGANSSAPSSPPAAVSVTGPVAIRQDLPPWQGGSSPRVEFTGTVRVMITVDGTVESAEMIQSVHPTYDPLLLKAARTWLYEPARRDGTPMPSEKTVTVHLKPFS
ncbi:MAG: energy transducer TonB [Vicinamibacterales bacterium]